MTQPQPVPTDPDPKTPLAATDETYKQSMKAVRELIERITPWLVEVGGWVFGGLIALVLVVMASLITLGPVDPAIIVATTAFALALPLALAGLFLLRLVQDRKHTGFEEEWAQVFPEVDLAVGEQGAAPDAREARRKRRTGIVLGYAFGVLALCVLLALTGITAALWHVAWWIGVVFLAMIVMSQGLVFAALATLEPPDSPEEQERKRRFREAFTRQAKEHYQKNSEKVEP